ncbi:macro domain-containing protein [Sorangium sp. So ce388]|uniref:macro domain-containing protein n=1 Tax=Sorangium sp. So ce388 TaxID=3133309 RepID=UPI003F5B385F
MTTEIIESSGDMFASGCEALVSPVDATGAQGAGLALAFARRFRRQASWYGDHGRRGFAEPGQVYHVLPKTGDDRLAAAHWLLERHRRDDTEPLVLFATTKLIWKEPSRTTWVVGCLEALVVVVNELGIRSVAIPALGCGKGQQGIKPADAFGWADVRPLMLAAAQQMQCERVVVFGPKE